MGREVGDWQKGVVSARWLQAHLGASWLRIVDVRDGSLATRRAPPPRESGIVLKSAEDFNPPRFVELGPGGGWLRAGAWPAQDGPSEVFRGGHIPGSIALDVGRSLFDAEGAPICALELAKVMSELGIGDAHAVVIVDDFQPAAALVAAWVLRQAGHASTGLLAGGYPRWVVEGAPTTRDIVLPPFARFTARVR